MCRFQWSVYLAAGHWESLSEKISPLVVSSVITASNPSRTAPFNGLNPRQQGFPAAPAGVARTRGVVRPTFWKPP